MVDASKRALAEAEPEAKRPRTDAEEQPAADIEPKRHTFGGSSFKAEAKEADESAVSSAPSSAKAAAAPEAAAKPAAKPAATADAAAAPAAAPAPAPAPAFGFGANSKFGNAFQQSLKKKSFLDEPEEPKAPATDASDTAATPQRDPVAYKQVDLEVKEIKTGEEDERSLFSATAKLFELDLTQIQSGWKERGVGQLHLNQAVADASQRRLVMRSQGLLRVILNMKLAADTRVMKGLEASLSPGKYLRVASVRDGKPVQYLMKFGSQAVRDELCEKIAAPKTPAASQSAASHGESTAASHGESTAASQAPASASSSASPSTSPSAAPSGASSPT
ncbi:RanBD1 domain-containing protein [[Candida] zeylanoides]